MARSRSAWGGLVVVAVVAGSCSRATAAIASRRSSSTPVSWLTGTRSAWPATPWAASRRSTSARTARPRSRFTVDGDYTPLRRGTRAIDQADLAVGDREPLHRPPPRSRRGRGDRGRRADRRRPDRDRHRDRPGVRAIRRGDARRAAGLRQGTGRHAARSRPGAATRDPLPESRPLDRQPPVRGADRGRGAARKVPRRLGRARQHAREPPRRPGRGRLEPQLHLRRARQPAGRPRRVDRAAAAVHAARQHDLREPALGARRRGPAGRRIQARRAPARAFPRAGAVLRPRRRADLPRPLAHDPPARRPQRPGRAAQELPAADAGGDGHALDQRRPPARRLPGDRRRPAGGCADARLQPALHAGLRGLARRLLDHRRVRRAGRLLARLDQLLRDPLRRGAEDRAVPALPGRQRAAGPDGTNVFSAGQAAALDCDPARGR